MTLHASSLSTLIVIALAVARAWRLISVDDAPFLVAIRERVLGGPTVISPGVTHYRHGLLAHLVNCPWCLGSYLSVGAFALARYSPGVAFWILGPLAVGELVGLIVRNLDPTEE